MTGLDRLSAKTLSDTIGAIYDCALNPQHWPDTCRSIAQLCDSTAGGICVHDVRQVQNDQLFVFGYEQEFLQELGSTTQKARWQLPIWSRMSATSSVSLWSPRRCQEVDSRKKYYNRSGLRT